MGFQLDLDLGREPPASGPAAAGPPVIRPADPAPDPELGAPVRAARHDLANELATDDLVETLALGDGQEIARGGEATGGSGSGHARRIALAAVEGTTGVVDTSLRPT